MGSPALFPPREALQVCAAHESGRGWCHPWHVGGEETSVLGEVVLALW